MSKNKLETNLTSIVRGQQNYMFTKRAEKNERRSVI